MIEIQNVSVSFDGKSVLRDFSHIFPDGKTTAVLGPSGVGKTTLLRLIAGFLKPNEGTVQHDPANTAFLFQEPRLCPWLTALENVNLVLGDKKSTSSEALRRLDQVGLSEDVGKYPSELSGGMQQRVALARLLAMPSRVVLMDEPFKGLDTETRARVLEVIKAETAGKTVIFVTHDQAEATYLADETLLLPQ